MSAVAVERDGNVIRVDFTAPRVRDEAGAHALYLRASEIDEDPSCFAEAAHLYAKAITLNPTLAIAMTNLGNIRYRQGDERAAEALYRDAVAVDARQPEALYNLGYIAIERGDFATAVRLLKDAVCSDPKFADAHFNLGMALKESGDDRGALVAFEAYLALTGDDGEWGQLAAEHVSRLRAKLAAPRGARRLTAQKQLSLPTGKTR